MKQTFVFGIPTLLLFLVIQILGSLLLWLSYLPMASQAHAASSISQTTGPGDLGTLVTPNGNVYGITEGTPVGNNLFHSFAQFSVGTGDVAQFQTTTLLPNTAIHNILGRVTGQNPSSIFGTIDSASYYPGANLFLMNPNGIIFGPTASLNIGGMATFTTANYLRLTDTGIIHANPATTSMLTSAPVAAFGFLGSNPAAISVQGSTLNVPSGQSISLVGGNQGFTYTNPDTGSNTSVPNGVTVTGGKLLTRGGQVNIASAASPGEFLAGTLEQVPNSNGQSFGALGEIRISQKSLLDVSGSGSGGGSVIIRGGQFIVNDSKIFANVTGPGIVTDGLESVGRGIDIDVAQKAVIENGAILETTVSGNASPGVQYGGVSVSANRIEILGSQDFENSPVTGIFSSVAQGNTGGSSGNIKLEANSILVRDFGTVTTFLETATDGTGNAGNIMLKTSGNLELDGHVFVESLAAASGNAGNIELTSAQGNIHMTNSPFINSLTGSLSSGSVGSIVVNAPNGDILLTGSPEFGPATLFTHINGTGANAGKGGIQLTAKNLTIENSGIQIDNFTSFQPGDLTVNLTDTLRLSGTDTPSTFLTTTRRSAQSADLNITAHDIFLTDGALVSTETYRNGDGGTLNIFTQHLDLTKGAQIASRSIFNPHGQPRETPSGAGGTITIQGLESPAESVLIDGAGSGIFTNTEGDGPGGNIFVNADSVTLQNEATLSAATSGTKVTAAGGNITVHADQIALRGGADITNSTSGAGDGGTVSLYANESISLVNSSIASNSETPPGTPIVGNGGQLNLSAPSITLEQGSALLARTTGTGRAGAIELNINTLSLADMSVVQTSTSSAGLAGSISVQGLGGSGTKAHTVLLAGGSSLSSDSLGNDEGEGGAAGNILVETQTLSLSGGSQITTSSISSPGDAGTITINAGEEVQLSQGILTSRSESNISDEFVNDYVIGNAGSIIVSAPTVTLKNNSRIASTTDSRYTGDPSKGNAGSVIVNATNLSLTEGSQLTSSSIIGDSGQSPVGNAGNVTVQVLASPASSVLINGVGSGIFTNTEGTGAGGNITLSANTVTLQNSGTLSAKASGPATTAAGGSITVNATDQVIMTDGALITARSTGPGNAGNIMIDAGQSFVATNSTVTTEANQASGGDIKITTTPNGTVELTNSTISASVADGPGGGGNISIDPQYVILQNGHILARTAQGQGGAITITTNLFLPDANSSVKADSGSGLNGTVTIQSPNAPASGKIQPLGNTPLQATSLLNQHCASLAGGEFSSFTVAGRDSLPTEPGSWLASPLATLSADAGLGTKGKKERSVARGDELAGTTLGASLAGKTALLSLRQIAPAGFLTQAFAIDWSTGCES